MRHRLTIRKLLALTAAFAAGIALLQSEYTFGIGITCLACMPLVALLMTWKPGRRRWLRLAMILLCSVPLYAVSMGPYIALQRTVWGHQSPSWYHVGYKLYRPFGFVWTTPILQTYAFQFEYTWQEIGFWLGRSLSLHDVEPVVYREESSAHRMHPRTRRYCSIPRYDPDRRQRTSLHINTLPQNE